MLMVLLRLFGLTLLGYVLFRIPLLQRRVLNPFVFVVLNLLFPLYFVDSFPAGWDAAVSVGWGWMVVFFGASVLMLTLQTATAHLLVTRTRIFKSNHPRELVVLFGIQNVGYIPLPVLAVLAPKSLMVYMFFFVLAFNFLFWTLAVSYISGGSKLTFKLNVPLIGIIVGLVLAMFHLYQYVPDIIRVPIRVGGQASMYLILVALGGVLATIPPSDLRYRKEFGWLILVKMVVYPAVLLGVVALIPFTGMHKDLAFGLRLAIVLEAAVPPATNTMIVAKAYGSDAQVHYAGSGIILTYLASLVTLPVFLFLTTLL